MSNIKLFQNQEIRSNWNADQEQWLFSVIDVVGALTGSVNSRKYWSVLKTRLKKEGSQLATNCSQLKMSSADGKSYLTDVATTESLLRLIQSIPSPRANPTETPANSQSTPCTSLRCPSMAVLQHVPHEDARQ